ncbi:MAG: thermonuclease family protein [Mesorhizobium sp.]|nr:MAG: thermonuclease family protein [Mesorhizobium sp.]
MGEAKSTGRLATTLGSLGLVAGALLVAASRHWLPLDLPSPPAQVASEARPASRIAVHDRRPGQPARRIAGTARPQDWRETLLYRPVATSSAIFESMGRRVIVSGTIEVDSAKTCAFGDVIWPCGQRARAAFNAWLRGRALKCVLPPDADRFAIAAPCMLGKQDVGAWLVANGWAMASPSGIYGKAESVARAAEMGVFGPPQ